MRAVSKGRESIGSLLSLILFSTGRGASPDRTPKCRGPPGGGVKREAKGARGQVDPGTSAGVTVGKVAPVKRTIG
jgi:hypothetical protein